jgi:PIN domain nuclease of toxin-antitoxin system
MSWLLDTHIAIFCIAEPWKLTAKERAIIDEPETRVVVSLVNVWEISVKNSLSRGRRNPFPLSAEMALNAFESAGYEVLPILGSHVCKVGDLPPLHGDPFDRLLVAQSLCENLSIFSRDWLIQRYLGE